MIVLNGSIIIEVIIGILFWWIGVYLFTQNPFNRIVQLASAFMATISFYFTGDLLLYSANQLGQYGLSEIVLRSLSFSMYLPLAFLYHASLSLLKPKNDTWSKIKLIAIYFFALIFIYIEGFTNLIRDYTLFTSIGFDGKLSNGIGNYFWLMGVFIVAIICMTGTNFYRLMIKEKVGTENWWKYALPFFGLLISFLLGPLVLLGYYKIIPYTQILPVIDLCFAFLPIVYSVLRYNLFLDEAKVFFGKTFYYSSLTTFIVVLVYIIMISFSFYALESAQTLILPLTLIYLIIASHPLYEWIITFTRDFIFNRSSGYSVVSDEEASRVLRDYNSPEKLEDNPLLRLNLIEKSLKNKTADHSVDALRSVVKEAVEFFKPEGNPSRRIKPNLRYHLLKMLMFDQAEEGQILWELGFEEYPSRIISQQGDSREPMFKINSSADYTYLSRNAFIALKKEAIHEVAWRISYLEKSSIRRK